MPKGVHIRTHAAWNKGLKTPPEVREKQRQAKLKNPVRYWLGKKKSPEHVAKWRQKMLGRTPWNKGEKTPLEVRLKQSLKAKGRKLPRQHYENLSKKFRGDGGSNWRGGTTKLEMIIRANSKYRQWRSDIFARDNFTCQKCGIRGNQTGGYLEAHHFPKLFCQMIETYKIKTLDEALLCEDLWNKNNAITLCRKCHDKTKFYVSKSQRRS